MVKYLLKEDSKDFKWYDLAVKFNISEGTKKKSDRGKNAKRIWSNFLKNVENNGQDLEVVKQTFKNGELLFETKKILPVEVDVDVSNMEISKVTTNPYGGKWISYKNEVGLSTDQIKKISDDFEFKPFNPSIVSNTNGIGVVDISDIHAGSLVKFMYETIKQRSFNIDVLNNYLDNAAKIINDYKFKEVSLFLPGDIIESFTGFNHRDTYKNIQSHQGEIITLSYQILKRLLSNINNLKKVYMTEGNHDRFTMQKDSDSRKGVGEVLAYFLAENTSVPIVYHPFMVSDEIDGLYHICTHGDYRSFQKNGYDTFFFKYGKQGMYNVLKTGHLHRFNIMSQTDEYMHYECPSIFTGGFFEEALGYNSLPAITIIQNIDYLCNIDYRTLCKYNKS